MNKAILFVDDEQIILMSLKSQLKKHFGNEYRYETAQNTEEAWSIIEELAEEGIDILIIISDWLMPNQRGDEFLRDVHKSYPAIKKIIISGHIDELSLNQLKGEVDLHSFLNKPWSESDLIKKVEDAITKIA
ncbi:response regulator [Leptospira kanakyensis]|uniref:Response regulator n=1 Tax=Leptospira kanakyensis TaxID=2484968 RepID=A0A6N4QQ42_9LEPT|nr:response regulator [Leptospira kanakyensis]MCW7468392.1 response regulator [Leptospira kanakyensis]MCW7482771.1 response regulator [Leptospira kanakyensis]TGK55468.1 response regulator [Leptospira kanakyensis]TGK61002.1 response regulator [Leptospira kanakyensis]TGK76525.1 response regulator [Leptospira kanakyensis]